MCPEIDKEGSSLTIGNTDLLGDFQDGGWSTTARKSLQDYPPGQILLWGKSTSPFFGKT